MKKLLGLVLVSLALYSSNTVSALMTYSYTSPLGTILRDIEEVPGSFQYNEILTVHFTMEELGADTEYYSRREGIPVDLVATNSRYTLSTSNIFISDDSSIPSSNFVVGTDSEGNIDYWGFSLFDENGATSSYINDFGRTMSFSSAGVGYSGAYIRTCINVNSSGICTWADQDSILAQGIGTWTVSPVPIPAAAWLFGSGLLGLVGLNYRKSKT
ncbi:MAG: hypothetical protein AB2705_22310 [Candidatus Thiodiazotropha sp.]